MVLLKQEQLNAKVLLIIITKVAVPMDIVHMVELHVRVHVDIIMDGNALDLVIY